MPLDLHALLRAQRALLASDVPAGGTAWLEGATEAVRGLLGCDHTLFLFPEIAEAAESTDDAEATGDDTVGPVVLRGRTLDTDPSVPRAFEAAFEGTWGGRTNWTDDLLTTSWSVRRHGGAGAYHERDLTPRSVVEGSAFFQEALRPHGLCHTMGLAVPLPDGQEYTLAVYFERDDAPGFSDDGLTALRQLLPAFEAAARTWAQLAASARDRRLALVRLVDALPPALLVGSDGAPLHRNRALRQMLNGEPDGGTRLVAALKRWGRYLCAVARETASEIAAPPATLKTPGGSYRLHGAPVDGVLLSGHEGALVFAERRGVDLPSTEALMRRHGLTLREAEVARLLARGMTDRQVAGELFIAHSTARRHVERVLGKLGLASRSALALHVLDAAKRDP